MPLIMPIRDLRKTNEIFKAAHREQPIFITKNGYSDLVFMSSELYDKIARGKCWDQVIYESKKEMSEGGEPMDLDEAFERLNKKHYG